MTKVIYFLLSQLRNATFDYTTAIHQHQIPFFGSKHFCVSLSLSILHKTGALRHSDRLFHTWQQCPFKTF
jgi:hypothetical protein